MRATQILIVAALVLGGCGADEKESPPRRLKRIDPSNMGDLSAVTLRLEDMVVTGDVDGVSSLWLDPEQLAGCRAGKAELPNEDLRTFLREKHEGFVTRSETTFSTAWYGKLAFNRRRTEAPQIMGKRLRGDSCPANRFGQAWVYVERDSPPRLTEHRFNLLRVDGEWKIFRYHARWINCRLEKFANERICSRLNRVPA